MTTIDRVTPETLFPGHHAVDLCTTLNQQEEDGWTYSVVPIDGTDRARIAVFDDNDIFIAWL